MAVIQETNVNLATHVRNILTEAGGIVGDNVSTFFKADAKLDMWSKFKPMIFNLPFINLWDKRTTDLYYYQGTDEYPCGLRIPVYSNVTKFKDALTNGKNETAWSYPLPAGGEAQPMRLGDFRRYNTSAINPFGQIPATAIATRSGSTGDSVQIDIEVNVPTGTAYNLGVSDFRVIGNGSVFKFADMYPGVYLVKGSSGRFRTSTSKLGSNDKFSVNFPLNYGEGGDYTAYTFLSSVVQNGSGSAGTFVSVGGTSMNGAAQPINIKPYGTQFTINTIASVEIGTKNFTYYVEIKNNSGAARTFQNVKMQLYHDFGNGWEPEGRAIVLDSSVSVPTTGKTYEGTGQHSVVFNTADANAGKFGIRTTSDTPEVIGKILTMEPVGDVSQ